MAPAPEIVPCPTTNTKVSTAPFRVFRYHFFIVKADPPRPLTFLAEAQTKDCCYLLRRCHIDADFYPAFQCEDRSTDYTSLFRGTGTVLKRRIEILWGINATQAAKDDGGAFSDCEYIESWLRQVWIFFVEKKAEYNLTDAEVESVQDGFRRHLLRV